MFLKIKSVDLSAGLWVNNAYCALRCAPFWKKECDLNTLRNCIPVRWNIYRTNRSLDTLTNLWNVQFFFVWSHVISCRGVFFNLASCRGVFVKHLVINLLSLIPLPLSSLLKTRFFFFSVVVIGISSQNYVVFKGCTCCIFTWHTMQASPIFLVVF